MGAEKVLDPLKLKALRALEELEGRQPPFSRKDRLALNLRVSTIEVNVGMKPNGQTFIGWQVFSKLRRAIFQSIESEYREKLAMIREELACWPDYGWES